MADEVLTRLESIWKDSADFLSVGSRVSLSNNNRFSMPNSNGFCYSFSFEEFSGIITLNWVKIDSTMRPFEVKSDKSNSDFVTSKFIIPLLDSFSANIEKKFHAKKDSFTFRQLLNKSEFEKITAENEYFSEFITLSLNVLQISPDEKKIFCIVLPKKMLLSMLCSIQYPELKDLSQREIDSIVEEFMQRKCIADIIDSFSDFASPDFSDSLDSSFMSKKKAEEYEREKEMCKNLSAFMDGAAKKIYKNLHDYRGSEYNVKILYSARFSDMKFAMSVTVNDFLVSAKLGGKLVYLRFDRKFFAKTFLNKTKISSTLEKIECDIFRNEFAVPIFDALKSIVEVRLKKYMISTAVSFAELSDKIVANTLSKTESGFLVTFQVRFEQEVSIADFYFPEDAVSMLEAANAFSNPDNGDIVHWEFPAGNMKNTEIMLCSFIFDEAAFKSGKTFVLEKEIGDTVDIVRNSKLIARGEIFIKNGKKCVRVKEVIGSDSDDEAGE